MELIQGLTSAEATRRFADGQYNKPVGDSQRSFISIVIKNVIDLPNAVIFTAVAFLLIYGQTQDAFLISGIMFLNTIISIFQEVQARNYLRSIQVLKKELVTVIRDGVEHELEPEKIVANDVIKISSGNYLYVDGVLLQGSSLLLDESILTGESDYVAKQPGDRMLSGSFVINGIGYYEATQIGSASFISKITKEAKKYVNYLSPLQFNINQIVKILVILSLGIVALLFAVNFNQELLDRIAVLRAIISIITSMVPQGIILTITLALTIGVIKMARKHIIVQRTNSIETMAEISILCLDKTGTLTVNQLDLKHQQVLNKSIPEKTVKELAAIFCKNSLEKNKTLLAIAKHFSLEQGITENEQALKINKQIPFNSKIKMSAMDLTYRGRRYLLILGPLDSITNKIDVSDLPLLTKLEEKHAAMGRRNLFFIVKILPPHTDENALNDTRIIYSPLLFFSIEDELRPKAGEIITSFLNQGIKPVIISGDGPGTLQALVKKLNIGAVSKIITGKELGVLESIGNSEFTEAVVAHDIFARITPEQKVKIIKVLQKIFRQVAMVGDGVNDALALKASNLGIALSSGAEVTRNIADVVLLDNNLFNLSRVMNEGRIILHNTLRSAQLLLVKNFYALIVLVSSLLLTLPFPFNPRSLMVLAFFVGNPPILAVLADQRKPQFRHKFLPELYRFLFLGGLIAGLLGVVILTSFFNPENAPIQTILLSFFIGTGLINYLLVINNTNKLSQISLKNWRTYLVLVLFVLYILLMEIEVARDFLNLEKLSPEHWLIILLFTAVYAVIFDLGNRIFAAFVRNNTK